MSTKISLQSKTDSALLQVFRDYSVCSHCTIRANYPVTGWVRTVLNKLENERFIVICSRCRQNLKFGDFTLFFCGVGQRNVRKFVQH